MLLLGCCFLAESSMCLCVFGQGMGHPQALRHTALQLATMPHRLAMGHRLLGEATAPRPTVLLRLAKRATLMATALGRTPTAVKATVPLTMVTFLLCHLAIAATRSAHVRLTICNSCAI